MKTNKILVPSGKTQTNKPGKTVRNISEGIWYVVRDATGWKLFAHPFHPESKIEDHTAFWEQILAPHLALKYNLSKKYERELALHPYAFPRGRVTKVGKHFIVYHGNDWQPFPARAEVAKAFHLGNRAKWVLDEHEMRMAWDVKCVGDLLNLKAELLDCKFICQS